MGEAALSRCSGRAGDRSRREGGEMMPGERTEQRRADEVSLHRESPPDAVAGIPQELQVLPRHPAALRLSPELSATLNSALDKLLEVIGVDGGAVRLLEEDTNELVLVAQRGVSSQWVQGTRRL